MNNNAMGTYLYVHTGDDTTDKNCSLCIGSTDNHLCDALLKNCHQGYFVKKTNQLTCDCGGAQTLAFHITNTYEFYRYTCLDCGKVVTETKNR